MEQSSAGLVLSRCAHCGGSLRAGAPWCTLCLTPTAAAPQPTPEPEPAAPFDPLTAPLELLVAGEPAPPGPGPAPSAPAETAPGWPCGTCETANAFDATTCTACGAGFLETVRQSEPPLLVLPLVGDLAQLDKAQRLGLAFGGVLLVVFATFLLGVLLG